MKRVDNFTTASFTGRKTRSSVSTFPFNHAIPNCAILVAQESYYDGATSAADLAAQASVVNGTTVFAGENVDSIGSGGRYDNTHLNETGADQRAMLAVAALIAALAA
ncbi:hypothetical protein ACS4RR_023730 [Rhizobium sp. Z1P35]